MTSIVETCDRLIHETFTSMQPGAEPEGLIRRLEQVTAMPRDGVAGGAAAPFLGGPDGRCGRAGS